MTELRTLWARLRRELGIGVRTFLGAWFAIALGLLIWIDLENPVAHEGTGDIVVGLLFGLCVCLAYAFWPAAVVAGGRLAFRIAGWSVLVPLPVIAIGVVASFWLASDWLVSLLTDVLASAAATCRAHSAFVAVFCLAVGIVFSPAAIMGLAKLCLALGLVFVLGATPGLALSVALLWRAMARRPAA